MTDDLGSGAFVHESIQRDTHEVLSCEPAFPVLLACDHASNHIPPRLDNLGVSAAALATHIAWDIGAAELTRTVARLLRVPAVLAATSRLVIDCNRRLDDPTAFPSESDNIPVPGNQGLDSIERRRRADQYYWPYHHAIRDELRALEDQVPAPALIGIHSFTPAIEGSPPRPWHIGVLWDRDERIAAPLLAGLRAAGGIVVGDNEPYSGKHPADFTLDHHAEAEGLPHVGIEVRQDLLQTSADIERWAIVLANALRPVLESRALYTLRAGPES